MYQGPLVLAPDLYTLEAMGDDEYRRYCGEHPVTLMLKSTAGHRLMLGCQKAADEWFGLGSGEAFASTCVEAES